MEIRSRSCLPLLMDATLDIIATSPSSRQPKFAPCPSIDSRGVFFYTPGTNQRFATVAQLVEQGPLKPKVLGSNPSRRTNKDFSERGSFLTLWTKARILPS